MSSERQSFATHGLEGADPRVRLSIHGLLRHHAQTRPNAVAVAAPGRRPLSYHRLFEQVKSVIGILRQRGLGSQDRVAIVLPNGPEMAVAFLSVAAAATSAPLNPAYSAHEFDFYFSDLKAKALITCRDLRSAAVDAASKRGIPVLQLTPRADEGAGLFELPCESHEATAEVFSGPQDVALVLHTSGTTSRPKIVPLTHANISSSAQNVRASLNLVEEDRCLNVMPLFHIHGLVGAVLSSITSGALVVCTPGFEASRFFEWMEEIEPTWYTAVPTIHQAILEKAPAYHRITCNHSLRFIRSSSSALSPSLMQELEEAFTTPVIESYGMTEAAHQMTSNPLPPRKRITGSVGVAAGPEVAIMDQSGILLLSGETGEIVIRGTNVTSGYADNPEANRSAFDRGWFRTGDQGYLDADGYLFVTGRLKEIINRGGEKVAPREIDEVLIRHPSVAQVVTFAVPHATLGEDVAAAVVLAEGCEATEEQIREFAFAHLTDHKVPSQIVIEQNIPKGPTGKLQRIGLADKLASHLQREYVAPRNKLERDLCDQWAKALGKKKIGLIDNFFALGGDSLVAAQLFSHMAESIGREISLATLFRSPTIKELASILTNRTESKSWSSLVEIQPLGSRRPFFIVHAHGGNVLGYHSLARHLGRDQPFYGLQAQGLDPSQNGPWEFEAMAANYLQEIRTIQASGPYLLGGWCLGGTVALEMARQLQSQGEEVDLLVMIQSSHRDYPRFPDGAIFLRALFSRLRGRIDMETRNLLEIERSQKLSYMSKRARSITTSLLSHIEKNLFLILNKTPIHFSQSQRLRNAVLGDALRRAEQAYQPRPYNGRVALFRVQKQPPGCFPDTTLGWGRLLNGKLSVHQIPGYPLRMLSEPRVRIVAKELRACLDSVQMS